MNVPVLTYPFLLAGLLVVALTPVVRAIAASAGFVARPQSDRWHKKPVPLLGGIAIAIAGTTSALFFGWPSPPLIAVVSASVMMGLVGVIDDIWQLKPSTKL